MTEKKPLQPSSATSGFFQEQPAIRSAFEEDEALKRVFRFYLPTSIQDSISPDLHRLSNLVQTPQIRRWNAHAERHPPYLETWNSWGSRIDTLHTSEGWRNLQNLGISEGIVALGHEGPHAEYNRLYQFLKYHLWCAHGSDVCCPSAMTDGAARMMKGRRGESEVEGKVFEGAYSRLVERDPEKAWTSGQWMTERPGGSDVRNTETLATLVSQSDAGAMTDVDGNPLGPYSINGFKWFSSATDANATVLLAKEPNGTISAFFAPTRRLRPGSSIPELNGISIQRLKSKLGTRALPTAELVLTDMRAWRLGSAGQGTKEISTILNITRVHNAVSAMSSWGRGLSISRAFSRVRKARGKLLMDLPPHVHTLAEQHVEYHAMMHLTFYTVFLLGLCEHPSSKRPSSKILPDQASSIPHLLRLLTPLTKLTTAKSAIAGLQECMESLGGVGYLENEDPSMNVAALFRGANVLSIWEGTTNVMADDLVRVIKGPTGSASIKALDEVISSVASHWKSSRRENWAEVLTSEWRENKRRIEENSRDALLLKGRHVAQNLSWIVCALLLGEDALSDGDPITIEIASRWIHQRSPLIESGRSVDEEAHWDRRIVFGDEGVGGSKL